MSEIIVPDVSFDIYPKEKIRDRVVHALLKDIIDMPSEPLYTLKTLEKAIEYLSGVAQAEGLQMKLEEWNRSVHGISLQKDFEKLFGAKIRYRERRVQVGDNLWDTARYYEWVKRPSRHHRGIRKVALSDIYDDHKKACEDAERDGRKIIDLYPTISTK